MANPNILFKGIPRGPTRAYTVRYVSQVKPQQVVIPCTGSFSLAAVAREANIPSSKIVCGDISLYSTALGQAIMGQDWRLDIKSDAPGVADEIRHFMNDPAEKAAAVLFMIRLLQFEGKELQHHKRDQQRELLFNKEYYLDDLKEQTLQLAAVLGKLTYQAQDMWITLEQFKADADTVILANPPRYTGGYERMFAGIENIFDWDEPDVSQFTEKDYPRLMDMLGAEPSHTLMYYATQGEDPAPQWNDPETGDPGWQSVFADLPASSKNNVAINWIVANHNPVGAEVSRAKIYDIAPKFKLFEGDIQSDSVLWAKRTDKLTGDYYRDLFIHKLPGSVTEVYVALLLDGTLSGIIGLHLADLRRGVVVTKGQRILDHCASVTFAFTVQHPNKRLHKLTLGSIISSWFWRDVLGQENWYELNGAPKNVKTVMLSPYPENKTARGILKQDDRDQQKDGSYKLYYSAPVMDRTREDTIAWWLKKYGGHTS